MYVCPVYIGYDRFLSFNTCVLFTFIAIFLNFHSKKIDFAVSTIYIMFMEQLHASLHTTTL